ncbi:MAG: RlmE family RNA methyltransferase [Polynucleobacter sp.]|nr:RlmE family RNA methyltransferase [Polynucleobacter sp.]
MAKNKSNKNWLHDHMNDPYVKLAQKEGYRARAAYKLKEIDEQDRLIKPGMVIVDLGSTPGSWSQYIRHRLVELGRDPVQKGLGKPDGTIIAIDLLPMEPVADVHFILDDFREERGLQSLRALIPGQDEKKVDLVLSDMAPNLSGVGVADSARMALLAELALDFAKAHLKPDGSLLIKCFHGSGYSQIVQSFKAVFKTVSPRKPKASRDKSAETFLLGRYLKEPKEA